MLTERTFVPNNLGSYRSIFHPGRNAPITLTRSGANLARWSCMPPMYQLHMLSCRGTGLGWIYVVLKRFFAAFSFLVPSPHSFWHPYTLFFCTASLSLLSFHKAFSILTLICANKCWFLCNCCLKVVYKYSHISCLLFKYKIFLLVFSKALVTYFLPIYVLMVVCFGFLLQVKFCMRYFY